MNVLKLLVSPWIVTTLLGAGCGGCGEDATPGESNTLRVEVCDNGEDDDGDGFVDCEARECQLQPECVRIPEEPSASVDDGGGIPPFFDSVRFLWAGDDAVIFGVDEDALARDHVSVIRGRVLDTDGEPIAGVHASIVGRPEFGYTYSRTDGAIDLVANGDREVVVRWESADHPAVDRRVDAPRLDYAHPSPVVMTPYDEAMTAIDLTKGGTHEATFAEDTDGRRSMRLYFAPETRAEVVEPDGTGSMPTAAL